MDNFINDKEIQKLQQIELEYNEDVANCVSLLTNEFNFQPAPCPVIESSLLYKALQSEGVVETFKTTSGNPDMAVYQVHYSRTSGTGRNYTRYYFQSFLGLLSLKREYPTTCILKETLQTRINDWFTKQDVDFTNQKKFSGQFHVVSSDKVKLKLLLDDRPLDELVTFPEMEAEIHGRFCLLRVSNNPGSEYDIKQLMQLAKKMYVIFS